MEVFVEASNEAQTRSPSPKQVLEVPNEIKQTNEGTGKIIFEDKIELTSSELCYPVNDREQSAHQLDTPKNVTLKPEPFMYQEIRIDQVSPVSGELNLEYLIEKKLSNSETNSPGSSISASPDLSQRISPNENVQPIHSENRQQNRKRFDIESILGVSAQQPTALDQILALLHNNLPEPAIVPLVNNELSQQLLPGVIISQKDGSDDYWSYCLFPNGTNNSGYAYVMKEIVCTEQTFLTGVYLERSQLEQFMKLRMSAQSKHYLGSVEGKYVKVAGPINLPPLVDTSEAECYPLLEETGIQIEHITRQHELRYPDLKKSLMHLVDIVIQVVKNNCGTGGESQTQQISGVTNSADHAQSYQEQLPSTSEPMEFSPSSKRPRLEETEPVNNFMNSFQSVISYFSPPPQPQPNPVASQVPMRAIIQSDCSAFKTFSRDQGKN
uniref:HSF_DOMAIN domain-containing protein n=1 Tax=Caenorhabditis tropicalis TaxID=1561998 RepID=A0A1I7TLJ4_9PELO